MSKDFFSTKKPRQSFSDIIPISKQKNRKLEGDQAIKKSEEKASIEIKEEYIAVAENFQPVQGISGQRPRLSAGRIPRWPFVSFFLIAVLAGLVYLGWKVLPRAEIKISLKKNPIVFNENVEVGKNFNLNQNYSSSTLIKLPAELFTENRNLSLSFPASGKEKIENKAQGKIVVYNSYSSDPQVLVVNTRFATSDNKIFHLKKSVTVPGAKIQEGKIISSLLEVDVIADEAGAEYNIGPVAKFTIPGFKGSPKYEGFYAKSDQPMAGGFVGEKAVPTEKDIKDAEAKINQNLEDILKMAIFPQLPKEFKIIDGSSKFEIVNKEINKEADKENNFSIFAEAKMKLIAFREKDLRDALIAKALFRLPEGDYETVKFDVEYGASRSDFDKGEMSFPAKGQLIFQSKIDADLFRRQIPGKSEIELKTLFFALPGLEKAQIRFWPIYVKKAPKDINKVKITIE